MADQKRDILDSSGTPVAKGPLWIPLIGILLGVAGTMLMLYSFNEGIMAALDGGGNGADPFIVLFFVGAAMAVAAIVLGIVGVRRGGHSVLSVFSILAGIIPGFLVLALFFLNAITVCCARPPTP
jgi:hypothetical protein